jgi:PAS domain S-box-containing protein
MSLNGTMVRFTGQLRELQASLAELLPAVQANAGWGVPGGQVLAALGELRTTLEELQVAEEELRRQAESQDDLRTAVEGERQYYFELFDAAPDAYVVTDMDGRIRAANQAAAQLLNVAGQWLAGKPLSIYFAADSRRGLRQRLQKLSEAPDGLAWEDQVQPRQAAPIEVAVSVSPKRPVGAGQPELRWRFHNITSRRESERALRDSEERYHRLVHASLEAIYLYESYSRRVLEANPAFLRLLGYNANEVQHLTVYDIAGHNRASIEAKWQQIMAGGPVDLGERLWRHKDGHLLDVQVTASRIRQGERDIIAIIGRDISAHKAAEARLRESEARFRRLAENAPDIIYRFRLRPDPGFEYISPAVTAMLGFTPDEFYADPELGARHTHPDDRDILRGVLNNPVRTGQLITIRRIAKDGRVVWTEQRPVVLCDDQGVPVAVEGIIRDITAQKRSEMENARLYEAERDQRALAEALRRTAELLNSTLDFGQVLDQILLQAEDLVQYDLALITLLEPEEQLNEVRSRGHEKFGRPEFAGQRRHTLADFPLLSAAATSGQPRAIPDTAADPDWVVVPETNWIRSHVLAPLRMKRHVTGFISLNSRTPNFYSEAHAPRLQALADQAAVALENALLFKQLHQGRQQLQHLSQRLLEVQETERRLIARELHDEIGQALTGLKLFLEVDHRGSRETPRDKLGTARSLVEDLISRVRDLSLELRPTMLDDLGLVPALLWLFERYRSQTGIEVSFQHIGVDRRFDPDLETAAYRIVQEALTNVARYAGVETATVNLWADAATLNVQVEDAGQGFDPNRARSEHPSNGLAGMRERATLLNGQLTVETAPGAGTQITAELPLRQATGAPEPARTA